MSRIRNIITTTLVGAATAFGVVSSANYVAHKIRDTVVHAGEEIVNGVVKEILVPAASEVIGEAVKEVVQDVEERIIMEQLLPGYSRMRLQEQNKFANSQ